MVTFRSILYSENWYLKDKKKSNGYLFFLGENGVQSYILREKQNYRRMPENKCRRNDIARKLPFINCECNNQFRDPESSLGIKINRSVFYGNSICT